MTRICSAVSEWQAVAVRQGRRNVGCTAWQGRPVCAVAVGRDTGWRWAASVRADLHCQDYAVKSGAKEACKGDHSDVL